MEAAKDYAGALRMYEPCTSELVLRIGVLSRCYLPAKELLIRRQAELEKQVAASLATGAEPDQTLIRMLVSINVALQEERRTIELFDVVVSRGFTATAKALHEAIWQELTELRRYADVVRWDASPKAQVSDNLEMVKSLSRSQPALATHQLRSVMFRKAIMLAEAQAATGRSDDARATLNAALEVLADVESFVLAVQRMKRAGSDELIAWTLAQADARLSASDAELVRGHLDEEHSPGN